MWALSPERLLSSLEEPMVLGEHMCGLYTRLGKYKYCHVLMGQG